MSDCNKIVRCFGGNIRIESAEPPQKLGFKKIYVSWIETYLTFLPKYALNLSTRPVQIHIKDKKLDKGLFRKEFKKFKIIIIFLV